MGTQAVDRHRGLLLEDKWKCGVSQTRATVKHLQILCFKTVFNIMEVTNTWNMPIKDVKGRGCIIFFCSIVKLLFRC